MFWKHINGRLFIQHERDSCYTICNCFLLANFIMSIRRTHQCFWHWPCYIFIIYTTQCISSRKLSSLSWSWQIRLGTVVIYDLDPVCPILVCGHFDQRCKSDRTTWFGRSYDVQWPLRAFWLYNDQLSVCGKASIHQVTTMLATFNNVLFPGHNHLLTTSTDDPTLWVSPKSAGGLWLFCIVCVIVDRALGSSSKAPGFGSNGWPREEVFRKLLILYCLCPPSSDGYLVEQGSYIVMIGYSCSWMWKCLIPPEEMRVWKRCVTSNTRGVKYGFKIQDSRCLLFKTQYMCTDRSGAFYRLNTIRWTHWDIRTINWNVHSPWISMLLKRMTKN